MVKSNIDTHRLGEGDFLVMTRIEKADPKYFQDSHRHDFYELIWFTEVENGARQLLDANEYPIKSQEVYVLTPNQVHKMTLGNKKGYAVAFSKDFLFSILGEAHEFAYASCYYKTCIPPEAQETFRQLFAMLELEFNHKRREKLIRSYFSALMFHLEEFLTVENQSLPKSETLGEILNLIEQNFKSEKGIDFYSERMKLTSRRVNYLLKNYTGKSLKQHLIQRTILEAKRKLLTEDILVKELAYELGYSDVSYFVNIFKQSTGDSPNQFKLHYLSR